MDVLVVTLLLSLLISALYNGVKTYAAFRRVLESINYFPGIRSVFADSSILAFAWRTVPGVVYRRDFPFYYRYELYKRFGADIFTFVSALPQPRVSVYLADPATIKEVALARTRFPKPMQYYGALKFYGSNLVASEHEEWKKFRKICAPSFTERNNKLVWDETVRIVNELFEDVWGAKDEVKVEDAIDITRSITLFVISVAGFGQRISWENAGLRLPGFQMTYKEAFVHMTSGAVLKAVMPSWLLNLGPTKRLRDIRVASAELKGYLQNMIDARRSSETKEERHDLFSNLLEASESETDGDAKLSDSELMGNIFIFLLAGHETTAHTLAFALALLALHQDEQEKLYKQTKTLLIDGELPKYSDLNAYTYSNAVVYETLRMFPPVAVIPKFAAEDSTLTTIDSAGKLVELNVPKGSDVNFDTTALHHNPRYWDDPHLFRPSRFLEDWPRDAFVPFSSGPRACIGRRFAEVEAIAVLVMLVSRYRWDVKFDPRFASESLEARRKRILSVVSGGLTTTPRQVPLMFTRRK